MKTLIIILLLPVLCLGQISGTSGDGTTDDSVALQAWLDAGSVEIPVGTETYRITEQLEIDQNGAQTVDFNGATIIVTGNSNFYAFLIEKTDRSTTIFRNLILDGNELLRNGIDVQSPVDMDNVTIPDLYDNDASVIGIRVDISNNGHSYGTYTFDNVDMSNIHSLSNSITGDAPGSARAMDINWYFNPPVTTTITINNFDWDGFYGEDGGPIRIDDNASGVEFSTTSHKVILSNGTISNFVRRGIKIGFDNVEAYNVTWNGITSSNPKYENNPAGLVGIRTTAFDPNGILDNIIFQNCTFNAGDYKWAIIDKMSATIAGCNFLNGAGIRIDNLSDSFIGDVLLCNNTFSATSQIIDQDIGTDPSPRNLSGTSIIYATSNNRPASEVITFDNYNYVEQSVSNCPTGPNIPTSFYYSDIERTFITVTWNTVEGVDGYRIYLDGSLYGATTNNVYTVSGLSANNNYDISVSSYIGGTESAQSVLPNIRTGLYPDEELLQDTGFNPETEPSNTTPYTNTFGLEERKVTQRSVEGDVRTLEKTYAKEPTWNRNGTFLRTDFDFDFYDGNTYVKDASASSQGMSNVWGYWNDNRSVNLNQNSYRERSADGTTLTTIRTFNYDAGSIAPTAETTPSWDGRYWAFEGTRGGQLYMFTYDAVADVVFGEVAINDLADGYTSVSANGTYAIAVSQNGPSDYFAVYNLQTLALIHSNLSTDIGHADHQVTIQGNEVFVGVENGVLVMYRLDTGVKIEILGNSAGGDTFTLGHASGKNFDQPGWIFFDDRDGGAYGDDTDPTQLRAYRKVLAVCLDENKSGYAEVLTRSYGTIVRNESNSFMPTPDPTGQKVAFNNYSDTANDTYMELYVAQRVTGENTNPPPNSGIINSSTITGNKSTQSIIITN